MMMKMNERLRRRLELRRSSAAQRHKSDKDYDRNDKSWLDELEEGERMIRWLASSRFNTPENIPSREIQEYLESRRWRYDVETYDSDERRYRAGGPNA